MQWLMGSLILGAVALLMRRVLHMDEHKSSAMRAVGSLRGELRTTYQVVAIEIETQSAILGITLDDAFSERRANQHQMAWRVVALAVVEWERLGKVISGLHRILSAFLPTTTGTPPVRRVAVGHFKTRAVLDTIGLYELLDRLLLGSKRRFGLQLRLLDRASTALSRDFGRVCRDGQTTLDSSEECWTRLDQCFHDFDLIAKETLLAMQALLGCQTPEAAHELVLELRMLIDRSMRVAVPSSNQLPVSRSRV